ncbi:EbsA family protein [Streptococcus acidominimus]|uniref:EbsA protein n=1 Tax=Streptococcus acidominimus TaxID=1326 RepID=A0A4Y9FPI8_STRAI|nr:EbsA family protein [Streptococcus acidominimus]MBF0818581.1 EbsA family protein [Streptococcus acidominimus]MBF0838213.1 EbsA family protein [Streptococcus acidominimus]MBF0847993.1 EbsA family protein [Streptococcus danieliae]TFU31081.1 EbsA protein [Streptococcus acidominimus]
MIKIFGRIRYHWQPELSWSIIYWSLAITPAFLALSLILEKLRISDTIIQLFVLVIIMFGIGWHRYFVIDEEYLRIASTNPFASKKVGIDTISKIEVTYLFVKIFSRDMPDGKVYYIRKWPKKYFVNALALNPHFQGEIVLTDHLVTQDYFEEYYANKD